MVNRPRICHRDIKGLWGIMKGVPMCVFLKVDVSSPRQGHRNYARYFHANLGQVMIVIVERLRAYVAEADSGVNILIVFRRSGSGDT